MATRNRARRNAGQPTKWVRLRGASDTWVELWNGRPVAIAARRSLGLDSLADARALAREQLHDAYGGRYSVGAWGPKNHEGIVKAVVTNAVRRNPGNTAEMKRSETDLIVDAREMGYRDGNSVSGSVVIDDFYSGLYRRVLDGSFAPDVRHVQKALKSRSNYESFAKKFRDYMEPGERLSDENMRKAYDAWTFAWASAASGKAASTAREMQRKDSDKTRSNPRRKPTKPRKNPEEAGTAAMFKRAYTEDIFRDGDEDAWMILQSLKPVLADTKVTRASFMRDSETAIVKIRRQIDRASPKRLDEYWNYADARAQE